MEIGKLFVDVRTDTHLSSNLLGHRRGNDLIMNQQIVKTWVVWTVDQASAKPAVVIQTEEYHAPWLALYQIIWLVTVSKLPVQKTCLIALTQLGLPYPDICYPDTWSGSLSGTWVPEDKYLVEMFAYMCVSRSHQKLTRFEPGRRELHAEPHVWPISCHVASLLWQEPKEELNKLLLMKVSSR